MSNPILNEVKLNNIDIEEYIIETDVEKTFNDSFRHALVRCKRSIMNVFNFVDNSVIGKTLTIKRGVSVATELFEFSGYVEDYVLYGGSVVLIGGDNLKKANKRLVTKSFDYNIDSEAGVISEIFKSLYNDYTDFTADATSVQNSGTVFIRQKVVCNNRPVFEAAQELADNLDWQQYYNPRTDRVNFEPKGFINSTEVLQTGVNIIGPVKWDIKSNELVNKVKVVGSEQEVEKEELGQLNVTSGWNTTAITLTKTPVSVKVFYGANTATTLLLRGGNEQTTESYDYTVDQENKMINWSTTVTANYYVDVHYSYMLPTPVVLNNVTSQDTYYFSEKVIFKSDLKNANDAENYGRSYLDRYSSPFRSTTLRVDNATDLEPGQQVRVIDSENGIDDYFLIKKVKIHRPYRYDEVEVGDELLKTSDFGVDVEKRIKRLEEDLGKSQDLLVHVIDFNREIRFERRHFELYGRTIETGVLYWDSDIQGDWGTASTGYNWGTTTDANYILQQRLPGYNVFKELIYDEYYKNSNTNATWSSTASTLTFTAGKIFESELLSKGTDFKYLKPVLGSVNTSVIRIDMSADGKNTWQTVSNNTRTEMLSHTTAGTAIKLIASGSTTLQNAVLTNNQISSAAITVYHEEG